MCLRVEKDTSDPQVVGLIAHEATHVWQQYADHIGESFPGREQEAYAIQWVTQTLYEEYLRRKRCKRKLSTLSEAH